MRIRNSPRCNGYFTIDAAIALLLILIVFSIASQHALLSSRILAQRSWQESSSATVAHISDYLVKGGAAQECGISADLISGQKCVAHHRLSSARLNAEKSAFEPNAARFGFSSIKIYISQMPVIASENQFCVYRDYYSKDESGAHPRAVVCAW